MKEKKDYQKVFESILKEAKNKRAFKGVKTKQTSVYQMLWKKNIERQNQG